MDLNSVLIGSEDPQRLRTFYTSLLGEPTWEADGYTTWQIGNGWLTVGFHDEVKGTNPSPGRLIWNIETADVAATFERMRDAGATVVAEPYQMGDDFDEFTGWIATFADPDGNYFQLLSPMPEQET
ncbi:MAG TPA: VOC family protein [Actinomycetota bacterium]|nr:VOC family protein [Actinomycetota bacterium]